MEPRRARDPHAPRDSGLASTERINRNVGLGRKFPIHCKLKLLALALFKVVQRGRSAGGAGVAGSSARMGDLSVVEALFYPVGSKAEFMRRFEFSKSTICNWVKTGHAEQDRAAAPFTFSPRQPLSCIRTLDLPTVDPRLDVFSSCPRSGCPTMPVIPYSSTQTVRPAFSKVPTRSRPTLRFQIAGWLTIEYTFREPGVKPFELANSECALNLLEITFAATEPAIGRIEAIHWGREAFSK